MASLDKKTFLEIEKSKIKREKAKLVLEKSIAFYFIFMLIGVIGFIYGYIDSYLLNTLIVLGIVILLLGTIPYIRMTLQEEKKIEKMLK